MLVIKIMKIKAKVLIQGYHIRECNLIEHNYIVEEQHLF